MHGAAVAALSLCRQRYRCIYLHYREPYLLHMSWCVLWRSQRACRELLVSACACCKAASRSCMTASKLASYSGHFWGITLLTASSCPT